MEEDNPFWNEADDHDFMKAFLENENHDAVRHTHTHSHPHTRLRTSVLALSV